MTDTKFKTKTKYFFGDIQVCDETFCFLHTISRKQLGCLLNHFDDHGLTTRTHGNSGKFLVGLHIYICINLLDGLTLPKPCIVHLLEIFTKPLLLKGEVKQKIKYN